MAFKLPDKPSPKAVCAELADFMEILAWINKSASARLATSYLNIIDDNITIDGEVYKGCEDQEDEHSERMDAVFAELDRRYHACGGAYPFEIDSIGTVLRFKDKAWSNPQSVTYLYLLAATRLNMTRDRKQAKIDGALEMEHISAHALKQYLGNPKSKVFVFGTSAGGNFKDRIDNLMSNLKEIGRYRAPDENAPVYAQDDKLDLAGWIPFNDGYPGQLIIFAQAKTGTTWNGKTHDLISRKFIAKWISHPFPVEPVEAFIVSESIDRTHWNKICIDAGLLMDRCRVVEYCAETIDHKLPKSMIKWTKAAQGTIANYLAP